MNDVLVVFRIGRVYLLPELGEGMIADRRDSPPSARESARIRAAHT